MGMHVLITGAKGLLGQAVAHQLKKLKFDCWCAGKDDLDITNQAMVFQSIDKFYPDVVIHCAAYTEVDKAENDKIACYKVNVEGTKNVALACERVRAKLLYISTDYVFDGNGSEPFEIDSPKNPLNYYGLTKSLGEEVVKNFVSRYFIVRTSWLFGMNGSNFITSILKQSRQKDEIRIVDDQIGSPTFAVDLACSLCDMIVTDKYGVYHITNEGFCSRAELAEEVIKQKNISVRIIRIKSSSYETMALRPLNSRLSKSSMDAAGFIRLPYWKDAVKRFLNEISTGLDLS